MLASSAQNKKAWEYNAYDFWLTHAGAPAEAARKALANPVACLRRYAAYFDRYEGLRVANICGSCGKKAIPLAILGADVTVFDISEQNRRYALEVAEAAGVPLQYEVTDVLEIDLARYGSAFDGVFMEGGVLHYFHDLDAFMAVMRGLLKPGGRMILSDFHPFNQVADALNLEQPTMGYFCQDVVEAEMAHARFYPPEIRQQMPRCLCRRYTISEIINATLVAGFTLRRFDEHPAWDRPDLPGEFTLLAAAP